jgi:glycine hydroxymethyltransferase
MATTEHSLSTLRSAGLETIDPAIAELLGREAERQRDQLELIASENFTWPAVMEAVGSVATNKYAEGYPGKRYYGGCEVVDDVERLAIERAKSLFGAEHANVQPHAGAQANMAAYHAVLDVGDTVLGLRLDHGGHLTHGHRVNFSGRNYHFVHYGVSPETELVDMDDVRRLAKEHRPKLIVTGASAYPRLLDFAAFREIADEVGALFMVDMAHISGLVAAGLHPNPVEWADIVTSTTHKTLAGPRSGFVLSRAELGPKIDSAVFPGLQGGPLCHATAAKAVCFAIAATPAFREYQGQVRVNADALAESLLEHGHRLVSGGTDTHLVLLNLRDSTWSGKDAEDRMHAVGLTANRNAVPFDERPPAVSSGVRLGTPAATMRGLDADDFREVGTIISDVLEPDADLPATARRVDALLARRPLYAGLGAYPTFDV